jgi:ABC-type Mn2+/Zn2+ transport system permease subunit
VLLIFGSSLLHAGAQMAVRHELTKALALPQAAHAFSSVLILLNWPHHQMLVLAVPVFLLLLGLEFVLSHLLRKRVAESHLLYIAVFIISQAVVILSQSKTSASHLHLNNLFASEILSLSYSDLWLPISGFVVAWCFNIYYKKDLALLIWDHRNTHYQMTKRYRWVQFLYLAYILGLSLLGSLTLGPLMTNAIFIMFPLFLLSQVKGRRLYLLSTQVLGLGCHLLGYLAALIWDFPPVPMIIISSLITLIFTSLFTKRSTQ